MGNTNTKYFCDMQGEEVRELRGSYQPLLNDEFAAAFPGIQGIKYDGFHKVVMWHETGVTVKSAKFGTLRGVLPLTRTINYKCRPSLHICNARCMGGKCGGVCECQCGGRNHGINNV